MIDANATAASSTIFEVLRGMCFPTVLDASRTRAVRATTALWLGIRDGGAGRLNGREYGRGDVKPG